MKMTTSRESENRLRGNYMANAYYFVKYGSRRKFSLMDNYYYDEEIERREFPKRRLIDSNIIQDD